jgi:hypothetical protein
VRRDLAGVALAHGEQLDDLPAGGVREGFERVHRCCVTRWLQNVKEVDSEP